MNDNHAVEVLNLLNHITVEQLQEVWPLLSQMADTKDSTFKNDTGEGNINGLASWKIDDNSAAGIPGGVELKDNIETSFSKGWMVDTVDIWMCQKLDHAKYELNMAIVDEEGERRDATMYIDRENIPVNSGPELDNFNKLLTIPNVKLDDNNFQRFPNPQYHTKNDIGYGIYVPISPASFTITFKEDPDKTINTITNPTLINSMKSHFPKLNIGDVYLLIEIFTNETWEEIKARVYQHTLILESSPKISA